MRQPFAEISGNIVSSSPVVPLPETVPIFVCQFKGSLQEPTATSEDVSFPSFGINDCGTTSESSWTHYVQGYDGNRVLGEIDQKIRSDFDRFLL